MSRVSFKPYNQGQQWLFPPSLEELVPKNHPLRVVNDIIDQIDITPLLQTYKGGGTSAYYPRMRTSFLCGLQEITHLTIIQ